ncbi:5205_t:CDS:2 [Cetraspora pellucida]|uniref:5205_t:CDS:1 n=1 Tax=Cetraspora pellucida TaxID=1433469 RepID=A0A9N9HRH6_9GLOM|nr:5205_t:CDS:2 [Cetraspora pellucida]
MSDNRKYDEYLACNSDRPPIIDGTPPCFANLMQRCWDSDFEKRPTSSEIYDIIVIENQIVQNLSSYLHLSRQTNIYFVGELKIPQISNQPK